MTDDLITPAGECCEGCRQATTAGIYYMPLTDAEYAHWVRGTYGPTAADRLAEMYEAIAGRPGWQRRADSGYHLHAIRQQGGVTCIVIGDPAGWGWQVSKGGEIVRSMLGDPAATAADAVRLADELAGR